MSVFGFTDVFDLTVLLHESDTGLTGVSVECKDAQIANQIAAILSEEDVKYIRILSKLYSITRFGYDAQHLAEKLAIGFESLGYKVDRAIAKKRSLEKIKVESFLFV